MVQRLLNSLSDDGSRHQIIVRPDKKIKKQIKNFSFLRHEQLF